MANIHGTYLNYYMYKTVTAKFRGRLAELISFTAPEVYHNCVEVEKIKIVVFEAEKGAFWVPYNRYLLLEILTL